MQSAKKAVLLLGHGSPISEANEPLRQVADEIRRRGLYDLVEAAFLQFEEPDFQKGVDILAGRGATEIALMPFFLYTGAHVSKDLPRELDEAKGRYGRIRFRMTRNIGYDPRLVDIAVERIEEAAAPGEGVGDGRAAPADRHPIEAESFRIIEEEIDLAGFGPVEREVVKRVIHATADFDFRDILAFSPGAVKAGCAAFARGAPVITDVRMVEAGISRARLGGFGSRLFCFSSDADVVAAARRRGMTRTAASMRKAAGLLDGAVVVIGNAPTALVELIKMAAEGGPRPSLVVGLPVGFVGAAESKQALMDSGLEYITSAGRKGGTSAAVAAVNALLIECASPALNL